MGARPILYGEKRRRTWPWWVGSFILAAVIGVVFYQMGPGIWARTVDDRSVTWSGGTCLTLARWDGLGWNEIASAPYDDARAAQWGEPDAVTACAPTTVLNGSVRLPDDATGGTYRLCDRTDECRTVRYTP